MKHQFTDEQIEATSLEVWAQPELRTGKKVRCDVPYSRAAARLILEARAERDVAQERLTKATYAYRAEWGKLRTERDAALARVRELEKESAECGFSQGAANSRIAALEAERDAVAKHAAIMAVGQHRCDARIAALEAELEAMHATPTPGLEETLALRGELLAAKLQLEELRVRRAETIAMCAQLEKENAELRERLGAWERDFSAVETRIAEGERLRVALELEETREFDPARKTGCGCEIVEERCEFCRAEDTLARMRTAMEADDE